MSCFSCIFKGKQPPGHQTVQTDEDFSSIENVKIYSYKELRKATMDFSPGNKVGEGGFGSVYKGTLKDGTVVAVKVLSHESRQGKREFLTELNVVSDITHENLVRLYGCCVEGDHRILVYNYLENNSLAQTLLGANRSNIQFSWSTRTKISIGVARGLAFLHEEVQPHVVHRDIKASNILLDNDLNPKISDFGLARLLPPNTTHVSTHVAGTIGYLAPEYAVRGQVTRKSDVYSFGVLLLEIVSGRCNTNTRLPYEEQFLLERTWAHYERGELAKIVDTFITDDMEIKEACMFLKVGLLCTQDGSKLRPAMSTVLKMLTGKMDVDSAEDNQPLYPDFMDLKIRSHNNKANEANNTIASKLFWCFSLSLLPETTRATMTFTAISDRE
ncbi:LOW QUALITY PROTEIN: putative serine/threonine-protein kinase [Asparagus officinalis]|uniref:LOW QUALITY PROTEIN: putative serine/threonine-protein kinase n=1 Tax=Asparagus officinalis TaxID=4686 RepID=UPI00098E4DBB|nr:LOW QUALITY PROTEIN: putative serine/threonine-protein kinase [Asparagus officinalis]